MRRRVPQPGVQLPAHLAEYRPEDWTDDPDDPLERYYYGHLRWLEARGDWHRAQIARVRGA